MSDVQKIDNINYVVRFLDIIEDKENRQQLVKDEPKLANAIAHYEKSEHEVLCNIATSPENKLQLLESIRSVHAYHIKNYGPEHYV